jgi:hypothetical protein
MCLNISRSGRGGREGVIKADKRRMEWEPFVYVPAFVAGAGRGISTDGTECLPYPGVTRFLCERSVVKIPQGRQFVPVLG